jgi:hypothetical protein
MCDSIEEGEIDMNIADIDKMEDSLKTITKYLLLLNEEEILQVSEAITTLVATIGKVVK